MHQAHDALLCIAEGRLLAEPERRRVTPEHWFKPAAAMRALFADLPEACDNTLAIARSCAVMAETPQTVAAALAPKSAPGTHRGEELRAMAREGLERRLGALGMPDEADARPPTANAWNTSSASSPDGLPRLLPDRGGLHPMGQGAGYPGRPRPWFGRRLGGRLGAD